MVNVVIIKKIKDGSRLHIKQNTTTTTMVLMKMVMIMTTTTMVLMKMVMIMTTITMTVMATMVMNWPVGDCYSVAI